MGVRFRYSVMVLLSCLSCWVCDFPGTRQPRTCPRLPHSSRASGPPPPDAGSKHTADVAPSASCAFKNSLFIFLPRGASEATAGSETRCDGSWGWGQTASPRGSEQEPGPGAREAGAGRRANQARAAWQLCTCETRQVTCLQIPRGWAWGPRPAGKREDSDRPGKARASRPQQPAAAGRRPPRPLGRRPRPCPLHLGLTGLRLQSRGSAHLGSPSWGTLQRPHPWGARVSARCEPKAPGHPSFTCAQRWQGRCGPRSLQGGGDGASRTQAASVYGPCPPDGAAQGC